MKQTLLNLFKPYRPTKEITAHDNVRMRGQAFVTFPDVETANKARREVGDFPLYGKPIVSWPKQGEAKPSKRNLRSLESDGD
jgi:RNA recognition motif-containing protein